MSGETKRVWVTPDGFNNDPSDEMWGRDYEVRMTGRCPECGEWLEIEYNAPLAHCECGSQEWYK